MEDKKKQYEQLAFVHQVLSQRQNYFLEEFEIAKDSIRLITTLANALADEIRAAEAPPEVILDQSKPTENQG